MSDQAFEKLRASVASAFAESDVKRAQEAAGQSWAYSICALPLQPGKPMLLGLNWGADRGTRHTPQTRAPGKDAYAEVARYPFVARSLPLLTRYVGRLENLNYLNVLPFRTPDLSFLTPRDWRLGIERFFFDALDAIQPPLIVILGTTAVAELADRMPVESKQISVMAGAKHVNAFLGTIRSPLAAHPFVALPHPNNKITTSARHQIWAEAFRHLKDDL